jgi:galactose mutarotase-like enzyme
VRVTNRGDADMPASFGFHPAFAWPLPYGEPRAAHRIRFEQDEPARLNGVSEDGLLLPAERDSPLDGRVLHLEDGLFERDALVWEDVQSRAVTYGAERGPALHIAFPDMPMLGIWTKPGARYVCVEPWQGHADPVGFGGEIWEKPGMLRIAPGESRAFEMQVTLRG